MRVQANGLAFEVDDQGPPSGEAVLLIMGLGMQLIAWPDELVADLVGRGHRVIRFDNRDIGLSQHLDHLGTPSLVQATLRHTFHLPVRAPYGLADLARDTHGVMDALGLRSAHVVGASMGGMVAQHVAAIWPDRVRSLTLIMTTSGARHLPQASLGVRHALLSRPKDNTDEARLAHFQRLFNVIGSPAYPPDPQLLRARMLASLRRSWHPAGTLRQLFAVAADGDRTPLLARIAAPTHIIHGEADPLVPVAAAHDLAGKIRGSSTDIIRGMGHDLPQALLARIAAGIATNAAKASSAASDS
jgi:pimeloyl-ACP methyl ester carboxylesterase